MSYKEDSLANYLLQVLEKVLCIKHTKRWWKERNYDNGCVRDPIKTEFSRYQTGYLKELVTFLIKK